MPSVAEMRKTPPGKRAERTMTVCLRPDLQAEVESLTNRLIALGVAEIKVDDDGEPVGPPRRYAGNNPPEQVDLQKQIDALLKEQRDHEGELRLRAIPDGEWRLWVDKFPTRDEESEPGKRDLRVSGGFCNSDALTEDLAPFLASWNGEALESSDWAAWLSDAMSGPEKVTAAQLVVSMQEVGTDFRQWRAALSTNLARFAASA